MIPLFALAPVISVYFLLLPIRGKWRLKAGLLAGCIAACIAVGAAVGAPLAGAAYSALFLIVGSFPVVLRREIKKAADAYRQREHPLKCEVAQRRLEFGQWSETKARLLDELERISKRYAFAKTLVTQTEERPILQELSAIFGSQKNVLGLALSMQEGEKGAKPAWSPVFTSGWVTEEDWKRVLESSPFDTSQAYSMPVPQSDFCKHPDRELTLVTGPVRWGKGTRGLLAVLFEGPPPRHFLEEVFIYAQFLGLGLHKTYLYKMVVEHSRRDGLTNLYLRRVFLERLHEEINFSKRYGTSFSVLMLDLDHFKAINDTYGHPIGDKVLKSLADCLRSALHPGVTISRYGGEEIAILVGLAPPEEVLKTAEDIRRSVERMVLTASDDMTALTVRIGKRKGELRVTVSVGVAHYLPDAPGPEEIIRRADAALYSAKESGRNCVREWRAPKN